MTPRFLAWLLAATGAFLIVLGHGPTQCDGDNCGTATVWPLGLFLVMMSAVPALASVRSSRGLDPVNVEAAFARLLASPETWSDKEATYVRSLLVNPVDSRQASVAEIETALTRYERR